MRVAALSLCCLLVLAGSVHPAAAVVVIDSMNQTSIPFNPNYTSASPDLPLNEPPLARNVTGFQPEGIHLQQWTPTSMLVSWQTGEERIANNTDPPAAYDPNSVAAYVKIGTQSGSYKTTIKGNHSLVYSYRYGVEAGATTYQSPIIHHVLVRNLRPATTYYYIVGNAKDGWSAEQSFKTLSASFPLRLGVVGDLGQTANTTVTLQHLLGNRPDAVLLVGDFSYADDHTSGDSSGNITWSNFTSSDQPRWDSWARMTQPVFSGLPLISLQGNHEVEGQSDKLYTTFEAVNARYPMPTEPGTINTGDNIGEQYLNVTVEGCSGTKPCTRAFVNESAFRPNSAYYSLDVPGVAHFVMLNNYISWGYESAQYKWLLKDLAAVDRDATPWLIVGFHVAPYHTYSNHFKESDTFMSIYEPIFYNASVDLVFSGHVHAYERSNPVYQYQEDDCGPMYTTIGDGGNVEGLYKTFIDEQPQNAYCSNISLYQLPGYQPTPGGETVITLQDGKFCPTSQPAYSAYRQPSFGHGILEIQDETTAVWQWHSNTEAGPVVADEATIIRDPLNCPPPGTSQARRRR